MRRLNLWDGMDEPSALAPRVVGFRSFFGSRTPFKLDRCLVVGVLATGFGKMDLRRLFGGGEGARRRRFTF